MRDRYIVGVSPVRKSPAGAPSNTATEPTNDEETPLIPNELAGGWP